MKKAKRIMSLLLVFVLAIGMTFATGCSKKSSSTDKLVVTVGDQKIYLQDMMYFIYSTEAQAQYYNQVYPNFLDMEYTKGVTMRQQMKQNVMDQTIMYEILYQKALAKKYKLSDAEVKTNTEQVQKLLDSIKADQLKLTGFTKENLLKVLEKITVGEKYYKDLIKSFNIDEKAIKDTIKFEDNRQYNTEYLFIPTISYDSNNKAVKLTDKEKATAKKTLTTALADVKAGKKFADISKANTTIKTNTLNFTAKDQKAEQAYKDAAMKLENDAYTTDIVETDSGYFIIKMLDNKSTESYDAAVKDAVSKAEQDAFTAEYDKIKKDYKTTINTKVWDAIVIGETTIVKTNTNTTDSGAATSGTNTTDKSTSGTNTTDKNTSDTTDTNSSSK